MTESLKLLILNLQQIGLEQISDIFIAPINADQKVIVDGASYTNNLHYTRTDSFSVKHNTKIQQFYVRSEGDENTSILLYSHVKEIESDNRIGVFSIGSAIHENQQESQLLICQILDVAMAGLAEDVFVKYNVSFRKCETKLFGRNGTLIFAHV